MNFMYNNEKFILDKDKFEDLLYFIEEQYNLGNELVMNRYDCICDVVEFQKYIIDEIMKKVPNSVIFDVSLCDSKNDYLKQKEELLKSNKIIISIGSSEFIKKIEVDSDDEQVIKDERNKIFYNYVLDFKRDYYGRLGIKYREIMFFTNDEYREYIKNAYDIASMSNFCSFNEVLVRESDSCSLDSLLERKYLRSSKTI